MSKRTLTDIIKQWSLPVKTLKERPKPIQLIKTVENAPNSLEAKLSVNPYARILASPLRRCTFHYNNFPSKMLLRFGLGWHQPTKLFWAYPTFKKSSGKGIYVNLSKKVLDIFGKGGYRKAFRGAGTYRTDMLSHIENLLFKESFTLFSKRPLNTFHVLTITNKSEWKSDIVSPMGYQCIISFNTTNTMCELDHQIQSIDTVHRHIPCYHIQHVWTKEDIESIKLPQKDTHIALGVPKTLDTVDLAVALWRCRKFLA